MQQPESPARAPAHDVEALRLASPGQNPPWPDTHGWWDTLFISYLNPLIRLGLRRPLESHDMFTLPAEDTNERLTAEFLRCWEAEKPSLTRTIWRRFKVTYMIYWIPLIFGLVCNGLIAPVILNAMLTYLSTPEIPLVWGLVAAAGLTVTNLIATWTVQRTRWRDRHVLANFRSSLLGLLFHKSAHLSMRARSEAGVGEVVNLLSGDLDRIGNFMQGTPDNAANVLVYIGATGLMWYYLAWPGLVGSALLVATTPLSNVIAKRLKAILSVKQRVTDTRVKYITEILNAMKLIKMSALEQEVKSKLGSIRTDELSKLRHQVFTREFMTAVSNTAPLLVMVLTFVLRAMFFPFTPAAIFTALSLFSILRTALASVPVQLNTMAEAQVSVERLERFLALPETPPRRLDAALAAGGNILISMRGVTCHWTAPPAPPALSDMTLMVRRGELLAVVGAVGAGKSSLLAAILGELPCTEGTVRVGAASIGYVAQEAWLFNGTLRDNVLFGNPFDQQRYDRVLDACALRPDLAVLPGGDLVELGQRGVNLSGGQKQRVSIARAVYADPELYLFDDPLSAVDAHVGKKLFATIRDGLAGRTRVLVTHQTSVLPHCDRIVVLRAGGVAAIGTYEQLHSLLPDLVPASALAEDHSVAKASAVNDEKAPAEGKAALSSPEERVHGAVSWQVYSKYLGEYGGLWMYAMLAALLVSAQAVSSFSDWWLAYWSANSTRHSLVYWLVVYLGGALASAFLNLSGSLAIAWAGIRACRVLHNALATRILRAPIAFFVSTPIGQILNRFTRDVRTVDEGLPPLVRNLALAIVGFGATTIIIAIVSPLLLLAFPPVVYGVYVIQKMFRENARELSRLDSIARSPIFQSFSETLSGVETIRAYQRQEALSRELAERVDRTTSPYWTNMILSRWFSVRIEMLAAAVIGASALSVVLQRGHMSVGTLGWMLSTTMAITASLNNIIRWFTTFEVNINSVERLQFYANIAAEALPIMDVRPPVSWPARGRIEFKDAWLRYREDLGPVLRGLTFVLQPGEKLGVVGRTGAGKSSLVLALLRLYELYQGAILIDDLDIATIGIQDLRTHISVIPQDPVLFASTVRENLDPFGLYREDELWAALERVQMRGVVQAQAAGLSAAIAAGGGNLSVGQRQLLCMARALLRKSRIVCLDEATASIDRSTEAVIQATLRDEFASATVITIAHRLDTVIGATRVMVLDGGKILELAPPRELMKDPSSAFFIMAAAQGIKPE